MKVSIFWFRRDLRLKDNTALYNALKSGFPVIPIFIFDDDILNGLAIDDARVNFIYDGVLYIELILFNDGPAIIKTINTSKSEAQSFQKFSKSNLI